MHGIKLVTDLIARLAQTSGKASSTVAFGQTEIQLDQHLVPTITVPGQMQRVGALAGTVQRESFVNEVSQRLPASTAATTVLCATFGRGLWDLYMSLSASADYSTTLAPLAFAQIADDLGAAADILSLMPGAAGANGALNCKFTIHLPSDGWALSLRSGATGVGQTNQAFLTVLANRLL